MREIINTDLPHYQPKQRAKTNGNYSYGCVCLQVRVNKATHKVVEIKSSGARPLTACRRERSLKKWKPMLE